ncbi:uncharacterized protein N7487_000140 [Penicillium crustosum]|uniref:uncharacterized protein n=1 Tax=Penicillium crustosum TaxID=36656 RepID=UPI00238999C4|nr:uncharacterized protein N7487_000140 [Penicillium crustosum]KAJ5416590.1 hypothetical protein N7487_000140 [Penicillium crustosum]
MSLLMELNRRNKTGNPEPDNNYMDSTRAGHSNCIGANPVYDIHLNALDCSVPSWPETSDYSKNKATSLYGDLVADPYYRGG